MSAEIGVVDGSPHDYGEGGVCKRSRAGRVEGALDRHCSNWTTRFKRPVATDLATR